MMDYAHDLIVTRLSQLDHDSYHSIARAQRDVDSARDELEDSRKELSNREQILADRQQERVELEAALERLAPVDV